MVESYNDLCATYLQSIWNRLYDRYGNYPNSIKPRTFDVDTKVHSKFLKVYIILDGKKSLYKKIRMLDKMVFNVNTCGSLSTREPLHLERDFTRLISENLIIV